MEKLSFEEMEQIHGGISKEEYCATVKEILAHGAATPDNEVAQIIYNICGAL